MTAKVKIAVTVLIEGSPIWSLALETNPKAATRLGDAEYTKVVRAAEAELKKQVSKELKQQHGAVE